MQFIINTNKYKMITIQILCKNIYFFINAKKQKKTNKKYDSYKYE